MRGDEITRDRKPEPGAAAARPHDRSNARGSRSAGMPAPVSATESSTTSPTDRAATDTEPPAGVCARHSRRG